MIAAWGGDIVVIGLNCRHREPGVSEAVGGATLEQGVPTNSPLLPLDDSGLWCSVSSFFLFFFLVVVLRQLFVFSFCNFLVFLFGYREVF